MSIKGTAINLRPGVRGVYFYSHGRAILFGEGHHCPIVLDQLINERYRILSLLGHGKNAMVWLAVDKHPRSLHSPKYVALKVFCDAESFDSGPSGIEERSLRKLMKQIGSDETERRLVIQLYDSFDIKSPNGIHRCLVLEPTGCSLGNHFMQEKEYSLVEILTIFKRCVEAVDYLHSRSISHGNLDLKTFAFGLPDLSELDEAHVADMLREDPGMTYQPVQMPSPPPGVPESLSSPNPFDSTELDWTSLHIKLIDFEGSYIDTEPNVHIHSRNCPAEHIDKMDVEICGSTRSDIWALGCVFWYFLAGYPLMSEFGQCTAEDRFQGQRKFLSLAPETRRARLQGLIVANFGKDEAECATAILDLLFSTLEPDPSDRPSAKELLSHPVFSLFGESQ